MTFKLKTYISIKSLQKVFLHFLFILSVSYISVSIDILIAMLVFDRLDP